MSLKVMQRIFSFILVAGMLLGFVAPAGAQTSEGAAKTAPLLSIGKVEGQVLDEISSNGQTEFLVWMATKADLSKAADLHTKTEKGQYVFDTLRATAEQTQKSLRGYLDTQGVTYRPFYIVNAIWVQGGNLDLVTSLSARADVSSITANHKFQLEKPFIDPEAGPMAPNTVATNVAFINADDAWAMGVTGEGTVVAGNDTGLQWDHPAIINHYRGWDGSVADHNYNWWDAWAWSPTVPADDYGHGTHTTGTMVGDDGAGNQIGVAPGAQTIHCKNMSGGGGDDAHFIICFEWDLAPWDLDGLNPLPEMAPDAINNSWGYGGGGVDAFREAVDNLQAAGIAVEVSAGNEGSSCQTLRSPGDYQEVITTGSIQHSGGVLPGTITGFSSRGPSSLDGNYFPDVMAPGENICSSVPGGGIDCGWSGTSMAGPHVTALVGLIWSACPAMQGDVETTYGIITQTAVPLTGQNGSNCGGDYDIGPNNDWGFGTIDAEAAVQTALGMCAGMGALDGTVTDVVSGDPIQAAHVVMAWGGGGSWSKDTDETGYYYREVPIGLYDITVSHPMYETATVSGVEVFTDTTTTQDFELTPRGMLFGYVTDFDSGMPLEGATVTADDGTTAVTDADGYYEMYLDEGSFDVTASLENYAPETATVDIVSGETTQQDFSLQGAIAFTPAPVAITVEMGDVAVELPATLINRQDFDYAFEFGEKYEGFVPAIKNLQTAVPVGQPVVPQGSSSGAAVQLFAPRINANNILLLSTTDVSQSVEKALIELGFSYDYSTAYPWTGIDFSPYDFVLVAMDGGLAEVADIAKLRTDVIDQGKMLIFLGGTCYQPFAQGMNDYIVQNNVGDYCWQVTGSPQWTLVDSGHPLADGLPDSYDYVGYYGGYYQIRVTDPEAEVVGINGEGWPAFFHKGTDGEFIWYIDSVYSSYWTDPSDYAFLRQVILNAMEFSGGGDRVPWFGQDPLAGTVPAAGAEPGTLDVTMLFTATYEAGVTQPGDYLATLKIKGDPNKDIPVAMTVNAPDTWGKIFGNVSSQGYCDADPYPLVEAIVYLETNTGAVYSATTDENGDYQWWLDESESPVDVSVSFPEHVDGLVEDVMVDPDEPQQVDFALRWNYPCVGVAPDSLSAELQWGDNSTQEMTISNTGAADLNFELKEVDKGWMPAIERFEGTLPEDTRPVSVGPAPKVELTGEKPAALNWPMAGPEAFAMDVYPGYNLVQFPDLEVPGTWNVIANIPSSQYFAGDFIGGDFSTLYVIDYGTNTLYSVDTASGAVTTIGPSTPRSGETWTGLTGSADGTMYGSTTNISRSTLYTIDIGTGATTEVGEITNAPAIIDIAINAEGDMFGVDIVNDNLVQIDPGTGAGTVIGSLGVSANYAQGMDFDEETGILWWAAYTSQGELRVIDTSNGASLLIGGFTGGAEVDSLAIATGGAADVPWLSEDIITGTVPADTGLQTVNVTMDSAGVTQPGEYYATLTVKSDDPVNSSVKVPVTMTVIPADDMGKLTGAIFDNCLGDPLEEVQVHILDGDPITQTFSGDLGKYTAWLVEGMYTVEFILDGYVTFEAEVTIVAGEETMLDVNLVPDRPCLETAPAVIEDWVLYDTEVYTFPGGFDITNKGAQDLEFTLFEVPPMGAGGGIDSLSGSFVVFDPTLGGDEFYIPGTPQTFCFHTESFTNDWEYVYDLWQRFPDNWTVNDAYVVGTPACDGGGSFSDFSWYYGDGANEIDIYHPRYQSPTDHCVADYCIDVTSGPGAVANVSWFWTGDGYGSAPHNPCSSDGYAPTGYTCDEAINPPAEIMVGNIDFPWFWAEPVSGTVPGETGFNVGIYLSSISETVPLPLGDYAMTLFTNSNDPVNSATATPVIMHVVDEYLVPEANFAAPAETCEDADTVFTNTTELGVPPITDYLWDFGDGTTSTEESPLHAFADAGVYTVTLEACNRIGCTEFAQPITVLPKPEASFTFETYWLEATFTNASVNADSYLWDFGDGITSTEMSPVHVYAAEGTYTVTLWAFNECGVVMITADVFVEQGYFYVLPLNFKATP